MLNRYSLVIAEFFCLWFPVTPFVNEVPMPKLHISLCITDLIFKQRNSWWVLTCMWKQWIIRITVFLLLIFVIGKGQLWRKKNLIIFSFFLLCSVFLGLQFTIFRIVAGEVSGKIYVALCFPSIIVFVLTREI